MLGDDVRPEQKNDPLLAVRVVLLVATAISAFVFPMVVTFIVGLAWVVALAWPKKRS